MDIPPVQNIVHVTQQRQTVERVYKTTDGEHEIEKTFYSITIYDSNGNLKTVTNTHQINYII